MLRATRSRVKRLEQHLHADADEDYAGDNLGYLRLEALCGVLADFVPDNAHGETRESDGRCGKNHVCVHEREGDSYGEGVDACRDRKQQDICDGEVLGRNFFTFLFSGVPAYGAPYHAKSEDAEDGAGDGGGYRTEPAFGETPEEVPDERHSALEYSETHCLEHRAAIADARLGKPGGNGDREAVHGLDDGDYDNFSKTHFIIRHARRVLSAFGLQDDWASPLSCILISTQ